MLALDEFVGIIRSVRADAPDTDAVRMFRRAAELTEVRIISVLDERTTLMAACNTVYICVYFVRYTPEPVRSIGPC